MYVKKGYLGPAVFYGPHSRRSVVVAVIGWNKYGAMLRVTPKCLEHFGTRNQLRYTKGAPLECGREYLTEISVTETYISTLCLQRAKEL